MQKKRADAGKTIDTSGVSPRTMSSTVYQKVRADILSGELQPGRRLRIETLMERYQVGASPMREALNRLSAGSFVKRLEQRGFQVAPVSVADLLELTRTRCLLNEITLREAIANGDTAWEDEMILACDRLGRTEGMLPNGEVNPLWEERHRRFHMALISTCRSRWLQELTESLFDCADRYRNLAMQSAPYDPNGPSGHRVIMEAALSRNADLTLRLLNDHISMTADTIAGLLTPVGEATARRPPQEPGAMEASPPRAMRRPARPGVAQPRRWGGS